MATSWPAMTADDVLSGRGAEGATVGQGLFGRDMVSHQGGTGVDVSGSTASATFATVDTLKVKVPEVVRSGHYIRLYIFLSNTGGDTTTARLQDNASSRNGAEVTTTSVGGEAKELTLDAPDASWAGTERVINVQLKTSGAGAAGVNSDRIGMGLRYSD